MNISSLKSQNIKQFSFGSRVIAPFSKSVSFSSSDSFIRTTNSRETQNSQVIHQKTDSKLNKIFDETYSKVLDFNSLNNPIFKELTIKKPSIKVVEFDSPQLHASYSFLENTISISKSILEEDLFLLCKKNEQGNIKRVFGFYTEKEVAKEKSKLKSNGNIEVIKVTDKEKNFYIASLFAHEIRHMLQAHVVASTCGCNEPFKNALSTQIDLITTLKMQLKKACKEIEECIAKAQTEGSPISPEIYEMLEKYKPDDDKDYSYGLEYSPSKVLSEDSKIKFSVLVSDKRELSVKEDLLPAEISKLTSGNNAEKIDYVCNLLEIDAFNHASEFILTYLPENKEDIRREILCSMALESRKNSVLGLDLLEYLKKLPEGMTQ